MRTLEEQIQEIHEVGRLFPDETTVLTVSPETPVHEALQLMVRHRYSQLPVVEDGRIRGLFSHWALAQLLSTSPKVDLTALEVSDVIEPARSVTVEDSLYEVLEILGEREALVVESPRGLQAIATAHDVLSYFYGVARPYVLLQEIELCLRAIINHCAPGDLLAECIDNALRGFYNAVKGTDPPATVEEMTFEDYRTLIISKKNWGHFAGVIGSNREIVGAKLQRIGKIRNRVFHFRRDIIVDEYSTLAANREWLLDKLRSTLRRSEGSR